MLYSHLDPTNGEHRKLMEERAEELRQEIKEGGYTSKKLESWDKKTLKEIEKWLKQK